MKELITVKEAAEMLNVSPQSIYRYLRKGLLIGAKGRSGIIRIKSNDVEKFFDFNVFNVQDEDEDKKTVNG